jgi:hypothetical protein
MARPVTRTLGELLIDLEETPAAKAVISGLLRGDEAGGGTYFVSDFHQVRIAFDNVWTELFDNDELTWTPSSTVSSLMLAAIPGRVLVHLCFIRRPLVQGLALRR